MNICYVLPGLGVSGGIRVVFEHANHLAERGHSVTIASPQIGRPAWFSLSPAVRVISPADAAKDKWEVVVATGYDTLETAIRIEGQRRFYFVQMMEHLFFHPSDPRYQQAIDSYISAFRLGFRPVTIAEWLKAELNKFGFIDTPIVRNGVNPADFYPSREEEAGDFILIEGDDRNFAKDIDRIGWRVALDLRERYGLKIVSYAGYPHRYSDKMDSFLLRPPTPIMRWLYSSALFTLKSSRFEGLSLSPLESFACGTPVCRAIVCGDDDVLDGVNARRVGYSAPDLYDAACSLIENPAELESVRNGALEYAQDKLRWADKIDQLENLYGG